MALLQEELTECIVVEIDYAQTRFINTVFMVKKHTKSGEKQKSMEQ